MDARNAPFLDSTMLPAVLSEMGKLAMEVGDIFDAFFPATWLKGDATRKEFNRVKAQWVAKFFSPHPSQG
jgi:hypothetical protein